MKPLLAFHITRSTGKTFVWAIHSPNGPVGDIRWHGPWRRYCFYPNRDTLWDRNCLTEVIAFIDAQMKLRKESAA